MPKIYSNDDIIKRFKNTHKNTYDYSKVNYISLDKKVTIICPVHGEFEQQPGNHINGNGCRKCQYDNIRLPTFSEKASIVHSNKYDYSLVDYINSATKVKIICPIHGEFEQTPNSHLRGKGCSKCKFSKGEKSIEQSLISLKINYEPQKTFIGCNGIKNKLPFDFYLIDYNICIEYHGAQHYEEVKGWGGKEKFDLITTRDNIKKKFCKDNNIPLVEIHYRDFRNIHTIISNLVKRSAA